MRDRSEYNLARLLKRHARLNGIAGWKKPFVSARSQRFAVVPPTMPIHHRVQRSASIVAHARTQKAIVAKTFARPDTVLKSAIRVMKFKQGKSILQP